MKILMAHNFYKIPGGEDESFKVESKMLRDNGHEVILYERLNSTISGKSGIKTALQAIWNQSTYTEIKNVILQNNIEIAHFQNVFPLISPSAYYAAKNAGAIVVQSLRNYRGICINATMFRNGEICTMCQKQYIPVSGVINSCYHNSKIASSAVASMLAIHKIADPNYKIVDAYIAVSEFVRQQYILAGFPAEKIFVKPNSLDEDMIAKSDIGHNFLYVGRLSKEKGIETLLKAWKHMPETIKLDVVGAGDEEKIYMEEYKSHTNINFLGRKTVDEVYKYVSAAAAVIVPSEWYEPFGRIATEAFAHGIPVISSNIGGLSEIIDHRENGILFKAGDVESLIGALSEFLENDKNRKIMGLSAKNKYKSLYNRQNNYNQLIAIYNDTRNRNGR